MNEIIIWHNPRCRKSREGLVLAEKIAEKNKLKLEIVKYLLQPPSKNELIKVLNMMQIKPIDLLRKKEAIWKENYKEKDLSDDEIIEAMIVNPKLIERPVVIYKDKAVLARPAERIYELL